MVRGPCRGDKLKPRPGRMPAKRGEKEESKRTRNQQRRKTGPEPTTAKGPPYTRTTDMQSRAEAKLALPEMLLVPNAA